jgi:lipoprotein-anchoring transpeptidase ErfK/SrfK
MKTSTIAGFSAALLGFAAVGGMLALPGGRESVPTRAPAASEAATPSAIPAVAQASPPRAEPAQTAPAEPPVDDRFVIKRILPIKGPIRYGEWHWDEAGIAPGPLVITVDLEARVLSVFRGGYEIGATAVLLGTEEKPTPTGVFPITQKKVDHVSNIYDAPMPFMQRLTNDGVAIHASNVENGYASHGCVGVPREFAKKLFGATQLGDRVYITRGKQVGLGDQIAS